MNASVSGIILAGGRGSRLGGVNKALLEVGGVPNIERVRTVLNSLCDDIVVVANDDALTDVPGARVVLDDEPHAGVLPALEKGLAEVIGELAVVVACDMPFLNRRLLREQLVRGAVVDVVMPVVDGRPEPMHAVYRRETCLAAVRGALASGERRMISFLEPLRVARMEEPELRQVDPELRSFFNTNTPDELATARQLVGETSDNPE